MPNVIEPEENPDTARFDPQRLAQIGRAVIGNRSIQEFCNDTSLSRSLVSRWLNCSLAAPPTIRSVLRFAGEDARVAREMLKACGYHDGTFDRLKEMPTLLKNTEKTSALTAVPELASNSTSGLSLMLEVLTDLKYGEQFTVDYRADGTFAIHSVAGYTLVGVSAFASPATEIDDVWRKCVSSFAVSLTRWCAENTCYFLITNVRRLFDKLSLTPNLNYKLSTLLTMDGKHFESQYVIPTFGANMEEKGGKVNEFPLQLVKASGPQA